MIIGLTGSFGAGKGAVVDYLVKEKGFKHFSARTFITEEISKQNIPVSRESLIDFGNRLRLEHGPAYIIETLFSQANKNGGNVVVESLRATEEAKYIKEQGSFVIGVDADPEIRYERMTARGTETDNVTYKEWKKQQAMETNPNEPTKQDIFGALKESDYIIMNNGTLDDLHKEVDRVLGEINS